MITEYDLQEAIAECEGQRNITANTCIKLAAFYTIKHYMFPEERPNEPSYSFENKRQYSSDTEFSSLIQGKDIDSVLRVMDDLMSTVMVLNPKLYSSVVRDLSSIR